MFSIFVIFYTEKEIMRWFPKKNPYYWFKQDPKPWDDLFHNLKLDNCPVLRPKK